jgi:hypothetical protein
MNDYQPGAEAGIVHPDASGSWPRTTRCAGLTIEQLKTSGSAAFPCTEEEDVVMKENSARFDWNILIPLAVNPTKIMVIEAMQWIERPLSATELERVFDNQIGVSAISYHLTSLRKWQVVRRVRQRQIRGVFESHYFFTDAICSSA